ncbi:hypothetical protein [Burkholderia seminalis]|uniref:hypothetical protein n=1 Tax=Burkholderia seminalis TaxID=488731 RepID=UPI001CF13761|nr:hypothetical protein [Burkholderia seminalis]MCA8433871.1 hypothetical protein [Burkholderia seminalis]
MMDYIDSCVLSEARALIADAGMADFLPASAAPASTGGELVAIDLIDSPRRNAGTPNFNKPDPDRPGVIRSTSILDAVRDGVPLPPLMLYQRSGEPRYELLAGFHRYHLFAALGYTHVYAEVTNWKLE